MTRVIFFFLIICDFVLFGCKSESVKHYDYIGQVSFRRTYAGLENLSDDKLDSVEKTNPSFMFPTHTSEDTMLNILIKLGIANKNEMLLDRITPFLKDTIFLTNRNFKTDTVFIKYDTAKAKASIYIKTIQTTDIIPIKDESFSHTFSLVQIKERSNPYIVFINQYYIMNGDNYEVSLYEKK